MRVEFLDADDARWDDALASLTHDVHQRAGWSRASVLLDGGQARAALVLSTDGALALVPFIDRPTAGERWDAVSPYGYAGPAFAARLTATQRRATFEAAASALREAGAVTWFVRLHPILDESWPDGLAGAQEHGQTVSMDLTTGPDARRAGLRAGHRNDIDRARRDGITAELVPANDPADLAMFQQLYTATMTRVGAADYYRFPPSYVRTLADELGDDLLVATARSRTGDALAAALFTLCRSSGLAQYHLSGSSGSGGPSATKLLVAQAADALHAHGATTLHLGGGRGSVDDSLFRFKSGFSDRRHRFRSVRRVLDPAEYARLCSVASRDAPPPDSGHFPAYRSPSTEPKPDPNLP